MKRSYKQSVLFPLCAVFFFAAPLAQAKNEMKSAADLFKEQCKDNGEYYPDVTITSVGGMTGYDSGNWKLIAITFVDNDNHEYTATKSLRNADQADVFVTRLALTAYATNPTTDFCVTKGGSLYGVNIR